MKKMILSLIATAGLITAVQAAACPEANYDGCVSDGYSIVEVEPMTYWPHNQMESAHLTVKPEVRHKRVRRKHSLLSLRSLFHCSR